MKNKMQAFSLSELTILLLISSFVLLAAIPALTMMKRSFMVKDQNVVACVTSGHADNIDLSKTVFSQILPDTDCQAAVKSCKAGIGNSCETMVSYINAYPTRAKKLLRASCDNGAKGACRYFIDACSKDNATCDIPTADAANQDLDLNYYLNLDTTSDVAGRTVIENDTVEHMGFGFANVAGAVEESCKNQNGDTACKIAADDCTENVNGTSCGYVVAGCNAGKANACKQGYSSGISRTCQTLKDVGKQNTDGIYAIVPDGSLTFKTYCDMTSDVKAWTLVALNNTIAGNIAPDWDNATNSTTYSGVPTDNLSLFKMFVGVKFWNTIGNKLKYQVGSSPSNLAHKATFDFSLGNLAAKYTLNLQNEKIDVCASGTCNTGIFSYNNGMKFSTHNADNDIDTNAGYCSPKYTNTPWWYRSCWAGSIWGGGELQGDGHKNAAYWNESNGEYFAHGSMWIQDTSEDYMPSCSAIKDANPHSGSGNYKIDPDGIGGIAPFNVYCDMTADGGGWTLVSRIASTNTSHVNTAAVGTLTSPTQTASAKFSDSTINSIPHNIYRLTCDGVSDYWRYNTGWSSTAPNNTANWTGNYSKDNYYDPAWFYALDRSSSDSGGGNYDYFDRVQYAFESNGCYHGGSKSGTLWVKQESESPPPTTCNAIKYIKPTAPSGVYRIDPDGTGSGTPINAYCDMTEDGGGWTLLFNHNIAGGYFASDAEALSSNETALIPNETNKYSILSKIPLFKNNSGYTFRINWPGSGSGVRNIWYQTSNPTDLVAVAGYTPLSIYLGTDSWGGLERSDINPGGSNGDSSTFIDGSVTGGACPTCWYYSIGSQTVWYTGIPASNNLTDGVGVSHVQLWVKDSYPVDTPTSCLSIDTKYPGLRTGAYTIDPDGSAGNAPFNVTCDMTTDGGGYTVLSSCNELNTRGLRGIGAPGLLGNDGTYMINPAGAAFKAYCDMTTDGGGWTMIAHAIGEDTTTLTANDIRSWTNINSDSCNLTNECISYAGDAISNWTDMLIYTRGYRVRGANCNDQNTTIKGYAGMAFPAVGSDITATSALGICDTMLEVSQGLAVSSNIKTDAGVPDNWKISMALKHLSNDDANENSFLHFGPDFIPQGFGTSRASSIAKLNNFYGGDAVYVYNNWDSASTAEQTWFIK